HWNATLGFRCRFHQISPFLDFPFSHSEPRTRLCLACCSLMNTRCSDFHCTIRIRRLDRSPSRLKFVCGKTRFVCVKLQSFRTCATRASACCSVHCPLVHQSLATPLRIADTTAFCIDSRARYRQPRNETKLLLVRSVPDHCLQFVRAGALAVAEHRQL